VWWVGAAVVAVLAVGGYLIGHRAGVNAERDYFAAGEPRIWPPAAIGRVHPDRVMTVQARARTMTG
jgi:hypothetical protein